MNTSVKTVRELLFFSAEHYADERAFILRKRYYGGDAMYLAPDERLVIW